jgi:2',3'-cyclic-nucleotide 2'-phosphodiesterase (5'-nucleotidase family)
MEKALRQHNAMEGEGSQKIEMTSGGGLMEVDEMSLTLLHTNDLHGFLTGKEGAGGFAEIAEKIKQINREKDNVLYLDAGDSTEGTHAANDVKGKSMVDSMNALDRELQAQDRSKISKAASTNRAAHKVFSALGNHETYYGGDVLKENISRFSHPTLACNVTDVDGKPLPNTKPYEIVTFKDRKGNEIRAAIVGVTTEETANKGSVKVSDPVAAVRENARKAKEEGADIVIVLSHCGTEKDREIAAASDDVGVIIAGHSHDRIEEPLKVNKALIVQAGSNAESLGQLDLRIDMKAKSIVPGKTEHRLIPITKDMPADPTIEKIVKKYEDRKKEAEYNREVGRLDEPLPSPKETSGETKLGNAFADRIREEAGADISLFNKGAFRSRLERGPVTKRHSDNCFHFKDKVVKVSMTGAEVRSIIEKSFHDAPNGGVYVASGMKVEYDAAAPGGQKVKKIMIRRKSADGIITFEELDPRKQYELATGSYLAEQKRWGAAGRTQEFRPAKEVFDEMLRDTTKKKDVFDVSLDRLKDISADDPSMREVIGRTMMPLIPPSDRHETNLGNFMADTVKESANASAGLLNRGSIKEGIDMGEITRRQMFFAFPYDDHLLSGDFTGEELASILEKSMDRRKGGMFAVSGLDVKFDHDAPSGEKVEEVRINGQSVDPGKTYRVAFTDFMKSAYEGLGAARNIVDHGRLRDLFALRAGRSRENPAYLQVASNRITQVPKDTMLA